MSSPGASSGEMPGFPFPGRPGSELDESLLDALLNGHSLPPEAPEQARVIAELLASLAGPACPGELAGEAAARSVFARNASPAGISPSARQSARRGRSPMLNRLSAGLAATLIAAAVGLGGAAAAYAGVLPGPIQAFAHQTIGAPAFRPAPAHTASPPVLQPAGMPMPGRALAPGWHWDTGTASGRAAVLAAAAALACLLGSLLAAFSLGRRRHAALPATTPGRGASAAAGMADGAGADNGNGNGNGGS